LKSFFPDAVLYSQLRVQSPEAIISDHLIIDNIGMLSKLYHYSTIAYVGGGFNKGIHNTIEAAVYGNPVLFGPNYKKFKEAIGLIENGGGICITSSNELSTILQKFISDKTALELSGKNSFDFVKQNKGATEKILHYIEANRLLLQKFISDKTALGLSGKNSFDFVKQNKGATEKILYYIEANRLLTN